MLPPLFTTRGRHRGHRGRRRPADPLVPALRPVPGAAPRVPRHRRAEHELLQDRERHRDGRRRRGRRPWGASTSPRRAASRSCASRRPSRRRRTRAAAADGIDALGSPVADTVNREVFASQDDAERHDLLHGSRHRTERKPLRVERRHRPYRRVRPRRELRGPRRRSAGRSLPRGPPDADGQPPGHRLRLEGHALLRRPRSRGDLPLHGRHRRQRQDLARALQEQEAPRAGAGARGPRLPRRRRRAPRRPRAQEGRRQGQDRVARLRRRAAAPVHEPEGEEAQEGEAGPAPRALALPHRRHRHRLADRRPGRGARRGPDPGGLLRLLGQQHLRGAALGREQALELHRGRAAGGALPGGVLGDGGPRRWARGRVRGRRRDAATPSTR